MMNNVSAMESSNQDESSQEFDELRQQISLNNGQLMELMEDPERFIDKLNDLSDQGIQHVEKEQLKEAMIYFQEGEKILEYGASCGKTIDRSLIIATLQNEASVYQRMWQLEKSSNYMEAIIFNTNAYLQTPLPIQLDHHITDSKSQSYANLSILVSKRLQIAFYYLQFSALSSQLEKHEVALGSALNALSMLKQVCHQCSNYQKLIKKQDNDGSKAILKELATVREGVQIQKHNRYILITKKSLKKLKNRCLKQEKIDPNSLEKLSEFLIGQVMQVSCVNLKQLQKAPSLNEEITYVEKIFKAIYISIAFFTIATELRLISTQNHPESNRKNSEQYLKSELYHLNSIIIAAKYSPCETKYLKHILKSYFTHYNIDLINQNQQSQETTGSTEGQQLLLTPNQLARVSDEWINQIKISKHDSMANINTFDSEKCLPKVKIPLLHMKKRKKKSDFKISKFDQSHASHKRSNKYSVTARNHEVTITRKRKSLIKYQADHPRFYYHQTNQKGNKVKKETKSKQKSLSKKKSLSRSKSKGNSNYDFKKGKSKDKVNTKIKKLHEQYFRKPEEKKKGKNIKFNTSNSLGKIKMESPLTIQSPRNLGVYHKQKQSITYL